jgi:hypothetical protein
MNLGLAELDYRENDGISVSLLWNRVTNELAVHVLDSSSSEEFELSCAPDEALDVFHHPFAYAATRPVRLRAPLSVASA